MEYGNPYIMEGADLAKVLPGVNSAGELPQLLRMRPQLIQNGVLPYSRRVLETRPLEPEQLGHGTHARIKIVSPAGCATRQLDRSCRNIFHQLVEEAIGI